MYIDYVMTNIMMLCLIPFYSKETSNLEKFKHGEYIINETIKYWNKSKYIIKFKFYGILNSNKNHTLQSKMKIVNKAIQKLSDLLNLIKRGGTNPDNTEDWGTGSPPKGTAPINPFEVALTKDQRENLKQQTNINNLLSSNPSLKIQQARKQSNPNKNLK